MRITELLKKESIELGVKVSDKEEAIDRLVSLMDAGGRLKDTAGYKEGILAREALGSTAIGEGIAIPHAKVEAVKEPGLAAMVVPEGVDYDAFDGSLANLLFVIAAPAEGADVHLEALSRLSTLLMNPGFKEGLIGAADKDEFLRIIDETEVEQRIYINDVNPSNATVVEMRALEAHYKVEKQGGFTSLPLEAGNMGLNDRRDFIAMFKKSIEDLNKLGKFDLSLLWTKSMDTYLDLTSANSKYK